MWKDERDDLMNVHEMSLINFQAKGLGKAKSEFQKATEEAEREMNAVDPTTPIEKKDAEKAFREGMCHVWHLGWAACVDGASTGAEMRACDEPTHDAPEPFASTAKSSR